MSDRAVIVASCWLAISVIASVYMWTFASKVADIFFGVFLPLGVLVGVALVVTFSLFPSREQGEK